MLSEAHTTTFAVNSTADDGDDNPGDGVCHTALNECTLRAGLEEANALFSAGDLDTHTIYLSTGTYAINDTLTIAGNILVLGQGWQATIIDATGAGARAFWVDAAATAMIQELTITDGSDATGGGIYNLGYLILHDVGLVDNSATSTSGGAVRNWGTLTVEEGCYIASNTAVQGGGAIANESGALLTVSDSAFATNSVSDALFGGGAIYNASGGTIDLARSSVRDNTAPMGGGIFNYGTAWLANVTVSGNDATTTYTNGGGGINNQSGATLDLKNVTIANNSTLTGQALVNIGTLNIAHTIVADNTNGDCFFSPSGTLDGVVHHNLDSDGSCFSAVNGNIPNTDPLLTTLSTPGYYGAHGLLPGSPAIDAGDEINGCRAKGVLLATDQRGRGRTADGDGDGSAVCDIGAFEVQIKMYLPLILR
jgi:CSLREA domain-containing protein